VLNMAPRAIGTAKYRQSRWMAFMFPSFALFELKR